VVAPMMSVEPTMGAPFAPEGGGMYIRSAQEQQAYEQYQEMKRLREGYQKALDTQTTSNERTAELQEQIAALTERIETLNTAMTTGPGREALVHMTTESISRADTDLYGLER